MNQCCICGKVLVGSGWLCNSCAKEWKLEGVDFKDWPEWVKALQTQEQRERRRAKHGLEVTFSDIPCGEDGLPSKRGLGVAFEELKDMGAYEYDDEAWA